MRVVLGAGFLLGVLWLMSGSEEEEAVETPARQEPRGSAEAIAACQGRVRAQLEPRSADFPFWRNIEEIEHLGGQRFYLESYVDSTGTYGQPMRYWYDCIIENGTVTRFAMDD